jgi:phosphomannomutase/phosphoglucomutase
MAKINKLMFREYDIRGRVDEDLTMEAVYLIGRGFSTFLRRRGLDEIVVGYDGREYSPRIKEALVKGFIESGIKVKDIGMVLTPILYFAQYHLKLKAGAMVTASHNPNGWSGFKLAYDYSTTLLPEDIKELYKIIEDDDFLEGKGEVEKIEGIIEAYKDDLLGRIKIKKPLKVVLDAGNGTAGPIVPAILKSAGFEVVKQYCSLDFTFPHHEPNPSLVEAMDALSGRVKREKANVGIGIDGDGDRMGTVDEKGNIIWPDQIMILLSRLILAEEPGAKIVFDVKSTQALAEDIKAHGGEPIMWITGHSYIKAKGREVGAALAGEKSGHIFFWKGYYGFDDAVFATLKLLEYLSGQEKSFSEIMKELPQYVNTPTLHVDCPDDKKYDAVDHLTREFKAEYGPERVIDINGARVVFPEGWGLVRASSNLPVLVLGFEAKTKEGLEKIQDIFREKFKQYPEIGSEWHSG